MRWSQQETPNEVKRNSHEHVEFQRRRIVHPELTLYPQEITRFIDILQLKLHSNIALAKKNSRRAKLSVS